MCLVIQLVAICCAIGSIDAIQCYSCSTDFDEGCGDPFTTGVEMTDCIQCRKLDVSNNILRSCNKNGIVYDEDCSSASSQTACYCNSDLCNHSTYTGVSMATSICSGLVILLFYLL